ncbi:uncharacterized protein N7500_008717 [Penicillium coprophilum]|uniref:uncharacterized protein n=1 Tax=Penicillium coprophilum TaxID=36646 RepID=UPI00239EF3B3|nr:uncharacterized protein N7500_008717 [Penicillium coprophilum]KAJ5159066.1 hypothetical protein N7500_008717 [Penicillium coprophilum]
MDGWKAQLGTALQICFLLFSSSIYPRPSCPANFSSSYQGVSYQFTSSIKPSDSQPAPKTVPPIVPVFLRNSAPYQRYLQEAAAGELSLPRLPQYEETSTGSIILYQGEVFCRLSYCKHGVNAFADTNSLRAHLRRHGVTIERVPLGRMTHAAKDATTGWYKSLFDEEQNKNEED